MSEINNNFDFQQIIKKVYESPNVVGAENPNLLRVRNIGGSLVPDIYDEVFLTYVSGGAADGEIATATYYLNSNLITTLTLEYYPDGLLKRVVRT